MHENALPVGAVVSGRYRILKVLGQGGFGITYLVQDEYLATTLALKECFPAQCVIRDVNSSQSVIPLPTKEELFRKLKEKFIDEARTIFKLHGAGPIEGIVHVYNVDEANNTGYMAMEYLDGKTLESYLNAQGPVDCIWLLTLVKPVLLALQCIHTQGLLHRDIAPDNLMLIQKGGKEKLVLFDFGAVKQVAKGRTTIAIAKPGYSPPEQFDPQKELTWAADIYALCATLYAMLGGSIPADATTRLSGIVLARKDPLIRLHELNSQIPIEVDSIIAKGMQIEPDKRYQSANEMVEDVERFLKKKQSITVEYYYNAILGKTEYVQKQAHSTLNMEQLKTEEPGFVLSKTENLPLQVSFDDNENIVRLYYISQRTAACTIEYYYDDTMEKETLTGVIVGSQVSYQDRPKPDFFFDHAENAPLTVSKNADENIIRVYYQSVANVTCKIEYYYDHKLDEAATLTFTGRVGERFSCQGYEKPRDMYSFDCAKNDPLVLSSDPEENIIRVYYSRKTVLVENNYIFHYCYDGIEKPAEKMAQPLTGNDLEQAVAKHAREKEGYRLVYQNVNSTSPGIVDITYYYESCKTTEPQPALSVKMSGDIQKNADYLHRDAELGDVIQYTLEVTNTGNIDLKDIVVSVSNEKNQCVYVSHQAFSLQPGSQKNISYQYTVEKHDALNEQIVRKAVVSGSCTWSKKIVEAKADCTLKVRPLNKPQPQPKPHKAAKRWWVWLALVLIVAAGIALFVPHVQPRDAESQYTLGMEYLYGTNREQDYAQAVKHLKSAAELGHSDAMNVLGSCYFYGSGVEQNYEEALRLYAESADLQNAAALNNYGLCCLNGYGCETDNAKAYECFAAAAEKGDAAGQYNLGYCYFYGLGVKQNYQQAVKCFLASAEQGNTNAQETLVYCYENGVGVTKDQTEADKWKRKLTDKQSEADGTATTKTAQSTKVTVGDYVEFGTYPQTAAGNDETPIEWLVLDRDGDNVLLLSRYGLDAQPYHTKWKSITWEECTLRTWLNNDFMNRAFTASEQSAILLTNVDNSRSQCYSGWSTSGGNNTQDKVFLLSYAEANKYLGVTNTDINNTKSRVAPTAYAIANGGHPASNSKTADGQAAARWWLRLPGSYESSAANVFIDGSLHYNSVNLNSISVRPALWVNLEIAGNLIRVCENLDKQNNTAEASPTVTVTAQNTKVTVGDYVTFGTYPQTAAGNDETPIEWLVLEKDGNKALLLSRYGLDAQPYHTKQESITWEECTLRTWLNNDFINRAFTATEQSAILLTNVDNSSSQSYIGWSSTFSGNNTQDKVFLLSYKEASKYLGVTYNDSNNTKSRVAPTAYTIAQGAWTSSDSKTADGQAAGWWWLRSPGGFRDGAAAVGTGGSLYYYYVINAWGSVRPALWVNLESGIF